MDPSGHFAELPNEYLRLLAATAIVKLDPDRKEFLSMIWKATESDHPVVQDPARELFGESADLND